jgi:hypothetical protein
MSRALAVTGTDRERMDRVFTALAAEGVALWFDLRGNTGVREDRYNDYIRAAEQAGTGRWVGEHVGSRDAGGARWGTDGVLYGEPDGDSPVREMWWSFNHNHPELAELLVRLFTEQGFDADWDGDPFRCVTVTLGGAR